MQFAYKENCWFQAVSLLNWVLL